MNEYTIHSVREGLRDCSALLNIPSKHQGRRTAFSFTDKYKSENGAPIMVAQATVISRYSVGKPLPTLDAEIGDTVNWVDLDGNTTTWTIVDDRVMYNPYLIPADD